MKKKVLIIEDDEEMCVEMSEILKERGYSVKTVFDGLEGKRCMEKNIFDLILLDIKMPGLNGLEILKYAKDSANKAKIIVLTGSLMISQMLDEERNIREDKNAAKLKLADGIMSKPFDVEIVLAKIKALIG
jgi:DNA-binding response OmpR family regulator